MREFVRAGEVAAVLGLDPKVSEWAIWNRMTEDEDDHDISDRSRWQARLASEIAAGVAKDHGLTIQKGLEPKVGNGIMPPRAWEIAPSARTEGLPSILVVMQRTQQSLYGWESPEKIPEKSAYRFLATAVAYEYEYVHIGILVDGYRSEIYRLKVNPETRETIITKVAEMIEMVRTDDEPVVDYDADREAILTGKAVVKSKESTATIEALLAEREEKKSQVTLHENNAKSLKQRIEQIDSIIIGSMPEDNNLDVGNSLLSTEKNSKGKLVLKITPKKTSAASLF